MPGGVREGARGDATPPRLTSARAGKAVVLGLAALGLSALALQAFRLDVPFSKSISSAGRFWRSDTRTRLFNSPAFVRDRAFGKELLDRDREWPLEWDVVLTLPPALGPTAAWDQLYKAAYVLSPRHVTLRLSPVPGGRAFLLEPLRPGEVPPR